MSPHRHIDPMREARLPVEGRLRRLIEKTD